jgi:hypothetical protein
MCYFFYYVYNNYRLTGESDDPLVPR